MKQAIGILVLLALITIDAVPLPFLSNVVLIASRSTSHSFVRANQACQKCLCSAYSDSSVIALNCYPNATCEFFLRYPRAYHLQAMNNAYLYFVRKIYPNASSTCCVSNTSYLLDRLQQVSINAVPRPVTRPRSLLLDSDGLLATIEEADGASAFFDRLNPVNLSLQNQQSLGAKPSNMAYRDGKFYISWYDNHTISVFNKSNSNNTLIYLNNFGASAGMNGVRDMIFLDNGRTMVVASADNSRLFFYNLTNDTNYVMTSSIAVNYTKPHGLHRVNDTFFYALSWENPSVYAYSYNQTTSNWTETLFIDATTNESSGGSHITIDDCNRIWLTVNNKGIRIYDENGNYLGDWLLGSGYFATVILGNYTVVMTNLDRSKIIRVNPQLQCDED